MQLSHKTHFLTTAKLSNMASQRQALAAGGGLGGKMPKVENAQRG